MLASAALAVSLAGCTTSGGTVPGCGDPLRLAIVAQSVPGAAYLPCLRDLQPGWTAAGFTPSQDGTSFLLNSDRSPEQPVTVRLTATCWTGGASPTPARAPGVLTYTRLASIQPRFSGTLYDVFPEFPDIRHIQSLRHLALRSESPISFRSRTDLQQLDSLCLSCTEIWYPEVLAQLKVSSLTLHSVTLLPSKSHITAPEPYWPNLKKLYLWGSV